MENGNLNNNNNKKKNCNFSSCTCYRTRARVLVLINRATLTTMGKDWGNPCTVPCPDLLLLDAHWMIKNERGWAKWGLLAEQSRPCVHAFLRPLAVYNFARTLRRYKFYVSKNNFFTSTLVHRCMTVVRLDDCRSRN